MIINCRFHGRKKGGKTKEDTQARAKVKVEGETDGQKTPIKGEQSNKEYGETYNGGSRNCSLLFLLDLRCAKCM